MRSFIASAILASSLVAAAPFSPPSGAALPSGTASASKPTGEASSGKVVLGPIPFVGTGVVGKGQTAFTVDSDDGFPNPSPEQIKAIEAIAGGTLSNETPPPSISADTATTLEVIAFNEFFEKAFFSTFLRNVTDNVSGFEISDKDERDFIIKSLTKIVADEELHNLNANMALKNFGFTPIEPCKYVFPGVDSLASAFATAKTFTGMVLGVLPAAQFGFANAGDNGLIRGVGSIIGNEAEQETFFRNQEKNLISPELPFLTASNGILGFSALQPFVVAGSCPNVDLIKIDVFNTISVLTPPKASDSVVKYEIDVQALSKSKRDASGSHGDMSGSYDASQLFVTYVNQQNKPISETPKDVKIKGDKITFAAEFPFEANQLNGLTIVLLTVGDGFADVDSATNATIAGPGLIEVN